MKKHFQIFFSTILLLSFSWQCAAKSAIFIHFKLNQKELANTVCENKDKPKSCCAAKCHLEKEIKKEDKRQTDAPSGNKEKFEKSELNTGYISFSFVRNSIQRNNDFLYLEKSPIKLSFSFFHPPCLI